MTKLFALTTVIILSASAIAEEKKDSSYLYSFGGIYADSQQWTHGAAPIKGADGKVNAGSRDQVVIGVEGGAGFTWGEIYGFYDVEAVDAKEYETKTSLKGTAHIYLGGSGFSFYNQVYNHTNKNQSEQNFVHGIGYTALAGESWFFKPFIGVHNIQNHDKFSPNQDINGHNGYMAGWLAVKRFSIGSQNFSVVNWHEIEFERNDAYAENQGGKTGQQGALGAYWHINQNWKTGIAYRYFENKLGIHGQSGGTQNYGDALIYRIQYDF